ncbi:hypothetical protein ACX1C1_13145 [Paenibacillus sp. strain BS8-2]
MNHDELTGLTRIEDIVTQLVQMVAENNKIVKGHDQRFEQLDQRMDGLEQRFETEKELNRLRHVELIKEIRNQHKETEYIRNQVALHDLEIYKLKEKSSEYKESSSSDTSREES